jgi:hypothetical protein
MEMRKDVSRLSQRRLRRPDLRTRARIGALAAEEMGSEAFGTVKPLPPSYFKSHREYVCVMEAIRHCWEEQVGSSCNIFIETHDNSYRKVDISCPEYVPNALCLR